MNRNLIYLIFMLMIGCTQEPSAQDTALEILSMQNDELGLEMVTQNNAEVVLRCESIVSETPDGILVRFKPIKILKGEISKEMLNADGLLDLENKFGDDVKVPNYYLIYIRKEESGQVITENTSFQNRYDYTLLNDDEI